MQIIILDGYSINPGDLSWDALREFGTVSVYDRTPQELVAQRLVGADAVFVNKCRIGEDQLKKAKNLKFICVLATGYDVVDTTAAKGRGITVCNIPAYSTDSVAQMTMALLLEICMNVGHHNREVHKGRWTHSPDFCFWDTPLIELAGLTFGVLGCGRIGCAAAKLAAAFGMHVIGYSRHEHPEFPGERVTFDELLARSDVLSLHCPSTVETRGVINGTTIAKMKDGAILLNTSRGSLIDPRSVADALNAGKLYAAGVDVALQEPINKNDPLLYAKNCVITPHIAWAPIAARQRLMRIAVENLRAFVNGTPINRVN